MQAWLLSESSEWVKKHCILVAIQPVSYFLFSLRRDTLVVGESNHFNARWQMLIGPLPLLDKPQVPVQVTSDDLKVDCYQRMWKENRGKLVAKPVSRNLQWQRFFVDLRIFTRIPMNNQRPCFGQLESHDPSIASRINQNVTVLDNIINNGFDPPFDHPLRLIPLEPPTERAASVGFSP
jgi:hypothetical protein